MAIFFGSLPISLIADKVTFFLGFDALYLYFKFNSFAIFAILFFDGLLLIKYKEKYFLDSLIQFFTALGILVEFLFIRVP